MTRVMRLALGVVLACGCGDDAPSTDAAPTSDGGPFADAGPTPDAIASLGWVDFAVTGCVSGAGIEGDPCVGTAPLELRFAILAPTSVTEQVWTFGDGSEPDRDPNPLHLYSLPGSYDVTLNVAGPGGTAGVSRLSTIVVETAPLGSTCQDDLQCESGECLCQDGLCPGALAGGLCTLDCTDDSDCVAAVCVELDPAATAAQSWQRRVCLPACNGGCTSGLSCQQLLGADGSWKEACFAADVLAPVGASCRDAWDALDHSACASGQCLDLGQRGMCSWPCADATCPGGSACATFAGSENEPVCLAACGDFACAQDPGLSCQDPDIDSFTVDGPVDPAGYCAPQ